MNKLELLAQVEADLYELADGNQGEGCWDLYNKYSELYKEEKKPKPATEFTINTHFGVIVCGVPPRMDLICAGSEDFCREKLAEWVEENPLGEYEEAEILQRVGITK